ncbi:urea transport system ATP-binding protein [Lipingzhangella halophila]|uniref:Urea transport system ATP-binding protein n=1 Tax=Lipingzhangella halophila TaxID=1783352 RepID=A0A7W7RP35_9ACTN|nr:urea ABC transporter ATP-binding protein UrtD [Lipingzhangella halophila]MBB4935006.1 urea transport system ATP-binding protein [Lipingzhangella halophila]
MTHPLLSLNGIRVAFGDFTAIDGIDLTVNEGELRFLIGPNGAGKTTLVDVVTGRTRPTSGTVTFAGQPIHGRSEHRIVRTGIGRTFQTSVVFEELTVTDNIDLAAHFRLSPLGLLRRRRGITATVGGVLERTGLAPLAGSLAGTLSHGQRQWLEIAMLLAQGPRLLLLDEPVAGMSRAERERTGELLTEISADHTVVVIEHDMEFLRRYARDVTVLHEGRILTEGTVGEVQADPRVQEVYLGRNQVTAPEHDGGDMLVRTANEEG